MAPQLNNPANDPHEQVKKKLRLHLKSDLFDEKMIAQVRRSYDVFMQREPIVYTRNERKRLLHDVLQEIFADMLADDGEPFQF